VKYQSGPRPEKVGETSKGHFTLEKRGDFSYKPALNPRPHFGRKALRASQGFAAAKLVSPKCEFSTIVAELYPPNKGAERVIKFPSYSFSPLI
jgi:hypothetical protein